MIPVATVLRQTSHPLGTPWLYHRKWGEINRCGWCTRSPSTGHASCSHCANLLVTCTFVRWQVWEVIKVDPSVGGSVVMKGGVNNLTHDERDEAWSQFGLSLLGNATLM